MLFLRRGVVIRFQICIFDTLNTALIFGFSDEYLL